MLGRARNLRSFLEAVDDAVETWIGYALPPAERVVAESDFHREPPGHACPRCGSSVGAGEVRDWTCGACRGRRPLIDAVVRLGPFEDPLRHWIHQVKYAGWHEMGMLLGRRLGTVVRERRVIEPEHAIVVPIPMPTLRRLHRGIDHARVIAAGLAETTRLPVRPVLARSAGPPQVTLSGAARRRRGSRNMRLRRRHASRSIAGRDVLLVDDVMTTGATLRGAARRLRRLGPGRIVVAVLAVTEARSTIPHFASEPGLTAPAKRLDSLRL